MIYTELTKKAMCIAFDAHKEQKDKAGLPYIYHPIAVAGGVTGEYEICVALLHDVVEDTDITVADLEKEFPPPVTEALRLLKHEEGVPYLDYIRAIKSNSIATAVKLSDLKHNSDLTRLSVITDCDRKRVEKYATARAILTEAPLISSPVIPHTV